MTALGIKRPYLVSVLVWIALMVGVIVAFGLGGFSGITRAVAGAISIIILVASAMSQYHLFVTKRLAWRSPRFGVPLLRLDRIESIQLDGRTLKSPEVGQLLFVAKNRAQLGDGHDLGEEELRVVREIAHELKATLLEKGEADT